MKEYFVYILHCRDGSYYTGITNDYIRRLNEHQMGESPTAYTFKRRPVRLVYLAVFRDVDQAIEWETRVKGWSRAKKEALIAKEFESLPELSWSIYRKRIEGIKNITNGEIMHCVILSSSKYVHIKRGSTIHSSTSSE